MLAYAKVKIDSGTFQFTFTFIILLSLLSILKWTCHGKYIRTYMLPIKEWNVLLIILISVSEKTNRKILVFIFSLQYVSTILQHCPLKVQKNTRFNNWLPELAFVETNIFYFKTFESFFFARKELTCQKVNIANLLVEKTNWKNSTRLSYKPWTPSSNLNHLLLPNSVQTLICYLCGCICWELWTAARPRGLQQNGCFSPWPVRIYGSRRKHPTTYATGPADKWHVDRPLMQPCANCTEPCAGRLLKSCCCGGSRKRN